MSIFILALWVSSAPAQLVDPVAPESETTSPVENAEGVSILDTMLDPESDPQTADEAVVDRMVAYENFVTYMDEDDWEQATDWAEQVVDLTEVEFGPDHVEMITPLNNLAVAQMRSGSYKLAETTFVRSLDIIDRELGIFHPRLVNPLTGLGTLMNTLGRHDDALNAFSARTARAASRGRRARPGADRDGQRHQPDPNAEGSVPGRRGIHGCLGCVLSAMRMVLAASSTPTR